MTHRKNQGTEAATKPFIVTCKILLKEQRNKSQEQQDLSMVVSINRLKELQNNVVCLCLSQANS